MSTRKDKQQGTLQDLIKLAHYLTPYKTQVGTAIFLMVLASAISVTIPLLSKIAIDDYILLQDFKGLVGLLLLALGLLLFMSGAGFIRARLMAIAGQGTVRKIRSDLFLKLQVLPISYFDRLPVGKLVTRLTSDVDALAELVSNAIVNMTVETLKIFGYLGLMLYLDPRLTLVALAFLPLLIFAIFFLNERIGKAEDKVREQASMVNAYLQESISGMKVIQAFESQDFFDQKFLKENTALLRMSNRAVAIFGFFWPIIDLTWVVSVAFLVFFGGRWVLEGSATIGTLIAFIAYSGQFFNPLRMIAQSYRIIQRALAGAVRLNQIFATEPETTKLPPMPRVGGDVTFDSVSFSYDGTEAVLKKINFAAKKGETIALVGHTGAGKTSIINVLCRFYAPDRGRVLVDGLDIAHYDLESYRRQIGLVLQEPFLFSGTLRENMQFGKVDATDEEILKALESVGLAETVRSQEMGLDVLLTERGSNFSTGQRQLLSFARALLLDPEILILDEATAYVDTLTEQTVQKALQKLLVGRTSFVIAHRLSTIRNADCILVMHQGEVLERGTHEELLRLKGTYFNLCSSASVAV